MDQLIMAVDAHRLFRVLLLGIGILPILYVFLRGEARWLLLGYSALLIGNMLWVIESVTERPALLELYVLLSVIGAGMFFLVSAYTNRRRLKMLEQEVQETGEVIRE